MMVKSKHSDRTSIIRITSHFSKQEHGRLGTICVSVCNRFL